MKKKLLALLLSVALVPNIFAEGGGEDVPPVDGGDGEKVSFFTKAKNFCVPASKLGWARLVTGAVVALNDIAVFVEMLASSEEKAEMIQKLIVSWATPWNADSRAYMGTAWAKDKRLCLQTSAAVYGTSAFALFEAGMGLWSFKGWMWPGKKDEDEVVVEVVEIVE